eukprot:11161678-Alexandrium_andersonii.AAC.1
MSASLVGSEMCIRDRHGAHERHANTPYKLKSAIAARRATRAGTHEYGTTCLLYTSDAADDM